jgi:hypothetical protein
MFRELEHDANHAANVGDSRTDRLPLLSHRATLNHFPQIFSFPGFLGFTSSGIGE